MLDFVSNLARALEYADDAAKLRALVQFLGANMDKPLNLVTMSSIVMLKMFVALLLVTYVMMHLPLLAKTPLQVEQ